MKVFEVDIMGDEAVQRAFERLVIRYGGKWWLTAQEGPGGGNPAYVFTLHDAQVRPFFNEFNGPDLMTPGRVTGVVKPKSEKDYLPDFGVMEVSKKSMLDYVSSAAADVTGFRKNRAAAFRQILGMATINLGNVMTGDDVLDMYARAKSELDPVKRDRIMQQVRSASQQLENLVCTLLDS
jgi:hypothetical protein